MANFREYNAKIKSLANMRRVTKSMKLVSATKMQRAMATKKKADTYSDSLNSIAERVAWAVEVAAQPLLRQRSVVRNGLIILYTSDMGLCSCFNNNLIKAVNRWITDNSGRFKILRMSVAGRKGYTFFKNRLEIRNYYEDLEAKPEFHKVLTLGDDILDAFKDNKYDEVYLAFNKYRSPMLQIPTIEKILPFHFEQPKSGKSQRIDYIFEPDRDLLLANILEKMVIQRMYCALLENSVGEHAARMTAMDCATNNIDSLTDLYTLKRNRARQASITNELVEIVSGAEALV